MANKNEVYIETALDTKALERGIAQVKQQLTSLEKSYNSLQAKQQKFLKTGGQQYTLSDEYKKASAEVERVGKALETALNRKEKLDETGAKTNTQSYKQLEHQIDQLSEKFWRAEKAKESLESSKYVVNPTWEKMQYDVDQVSSKIESGKTVLSSYQKQLNNLRKGSKSVELLKNSFSKLKKTASGLENILKKCSKSLLGFGKSSNKSFHGGFKGLLKTSIKFGIILSLIKAATTGFTEGFKALAQFNDGMNPTNTALSNLKSSLTQLRNSLATAFSPILTVVEPILTMFIQKVSDAVTAVGMLIAKLTGAETFTKAVKVQQNFAEELDETAAGAKDAKKEMEGYLSPLDEINKMQPREKDASGVGTGVTPNDMFEEVKIPSSFGNIADQIKSMWENADFSSLGETVGTKIKEGLDYIKWKPIKNKLKKIGKSISTFLNGFLETDDLGTSIGKTIGESINSGIALVDGFLNNFHFQSLGTFLADLFISAISTTDWGGVAKSISNKIIGLFETADTFLETADWKKVGQAIADFISGIKWKEILLELGDLGESIIDSLIDVIIGWYETDPLSASIAGLVSIASIVGKIVLTEKDIVELKALGGKIFGWIGAGIVAAITGFEIGKEIGKALFPEDEKLYEEATFKQYLEDVVYFYTEMLPAAVGDVFISIKTKFEDNKKTLVEKWTEITSGLKDKHPKIYFAFMGSRSTIKKKFEDIVSGIKNRQVKISFVLQKWSEIKQGLKNIINAMITFINTNFIGKLNRMFRITIPKNKATDYLGIGGTHQIINIPNIPMLANGAVIPANRSFMAVLGDQKHGNNLEAPEGLIRKIVREESGGGGKTINLNVQLDGRTVYQRVIEIGKQDETILGVNPFKLA